MVVLGINLDKNGFSYTVLSGVKNNPQLITSDHTTNSHSGNTQQLVNWYETTFENLITQYSPNTISLKVSLNAKKAEIAPWYYPLGILHNMAFRKGIQVNEFVSQNFTASKFGLAKGTDIYTYIDQIFGIQTPKWSKNQKYSVLAAWMTL